MAEFSVCALRWHDDRRRLFLQRRFTLAFCFAAHHEHDAWHVYGRWTRRQPS